ncbi:MAG TPA: tRNA (adenosine(37)-N6)-threonylcarbamoyltransferase complex dimerization subunit type 1 TsaB [Ktedonobacterales bacterium]
MLLAIDTSTSVAGMALVEGERLVTELTWHAGNRHGTDLFARLTQLFETYAVAPEQLDGIAVATGPGSFNGVRVALASAKSLAFALDRPLYGVPTLDAIAWGASFVQGTVWAILEAGRGQLYAAAYDAPCANPAEWAPRDGYAILTPAEVATRVTQSVVFCGEWRAETRAALADALGSRARFAATLEAGRAGWLARLALARAAAGRPDEPAALEPLYLRRPAITRSTKVALPPGEGEGDSARPTTATGGEGASGAIHG